MSTFGREADAAWYRNRHRETGDKAYLRLAEQTEAWLQRARDTRRTVETKARGAARVARKRPNCHYKGRNTSPEALIPHLSISLRQLNPLSNLAKAI